MRYKIGEVSKILNIPVETIRYYEKIGIINPYKDEENNYRYYESEDINLLLDYKKYKSLGFSTNKISKIMTQDSLDEFIDEISENKKIIEKRLKFYKLFLEKTDNYLDTLEKINENLFSLSVREFSDYYFLPLRDKSEYFTKKNIIGESPWWIENYPFIERTIRIDLKNIKNYFEGKDINFEWGFSVRKRWADVLEIPEKEKSIFLPYAKSIYTVIEIATGKYFSLDYLDNAFKYIDENNLKITGDIVGHLLMKNNTNRFIEIWIPVLNK